MRSRFLEASQRIVGAVRAGATLDAAASQAGVSVHTARGWAQKGRKDPEGAFGAFARDLDAAREASSANSGEMSWEEFEACLAKAVRDGSVQAMKVFATLHRPQTPARAADAFEELDELARRRAGR